MSEVNLLILSVGTRNKIVQYFKQTLANDGHVYTADCSPFAPALYEGSQHFIVPKVSHPDYITSVLTICKDYQVDGIISLIDPELILLSEHHETFAQVGTTLILSDVEAIKLCDNKHTFHHYLKEHGYNFIPTYKNLASFQKDFNENKIQFPVIIKPFNGSASLNVRKIHSMDELLVFFELYDDLIIQQFIDGTEYSVDAYSDLYSREVTSLFIKEKLLMRSGETDKSVSVIIPKMTDLVVALIEELGLVGPIDLDVFEMDGEYYISEINPRFGGGYLHAYETGTNFPKMIINNLKNIQNETKLNSYKEGTYMFKYNEIIILDEL